MARNLRNRVNSYVVGRGSRVHPITNALIPEIETIDFVTTNNDLFIPQEILIPFDVEDEELIDEWLTSQAGRKTNVRVPQRGRGVDRVELANRNARLSHESRFRKSQQDRLDIAAQRLGKFSVTPTDGRSARADSPVAGTTTIGLERSL